jgi:hypothetical protein
VTELLHPNVRVYLGPNENDSACEQLLEWLHNNHISFSRICATHFGELRDEALRDSRYGDRLREGLPAVFLCEDETVLLAGHVPTSEFLMMIGRMYLGAEPEVPPQITLH